MSGSLVPFFMNSGISPEFTQLIFRFGEVATLAITPVFAYFVIYLAYLESYNQNEKPIRVNSEPTHNELMLQRHTSTTVSYAFCHNQLRGDRTKESYSQE